LYVNGIIMTMAAGGAFSDSLASRFTKDARRVAGRCLSHFQVRSISRRKWKGPTWN
jgi:hypothetical protein